MKLSDLVKNGEGFFAVIESVEGIPLAIVNRPATRECVESALQATPGAVDATIWVVSGSRLSTRNWSATGASYGGHTIAEHVRAKIERILVEHNARQRAATAVA